MNYNAEIAILEMDGNKECRANEQTSKRVNKQRIIQICMHTENQSIPVNIFDSEYFKTNDINVIMA